MLTFIFSFVYFFFLDGSPKTPMTVTPIQGPIYLKNGTVPVVPLFHYPSFNNGSFVQIPVSRQEMKK